MVRIHGGPTNLFMQRRSSGEFAIEVVTALEEGFRNEKHRQQWRNTLATYARRIWRKPIDEVDTDDVLSVLKPIWKTKQETASRVRGRVERVLDAAAAKGLRDGANPARWRGHLQTLLPKREKLARGHHPAMPYAVVPEFIKKRGSSTPYPLEVSNSSS